MALPDPSPRFRKLTYEDYVLIPGDGRRHEILDGEPYVTPAPLTRHQRVSARLHGNLEPFVFERRLGLVLAAPTDVVLSPHDVAQPDLLFISNARMEIVTEENIQGAPDLVVEILSESTRRRDERLKQDLYERFGVQEYWLVDSERRTIRVFRRDANRFLLAAELSAAVGDSLASPLLPGLKLPLAAIFA
jgi:Uma2 family endonuclease